jgi:hypothetical protein
MPTTFFFSNRASPLTGLAFSTGWSGTAGATRWQLDLERGAWPIIVGDTISFGAATADYKHLDRQFVSPPLKGNQLISGKISGQLQVEEFVTNDNVDRICTHIRVVSRDGTQLRGTGLGVAKYGSTNEFSTTLTTRNICSGLTSVQNINALDGDRIVVELGYSNSTAGTTPQAAALWGHSRSATNRSGRKPNRQWGRFSDPK